MHAETWPITASNFGSCISFQPFCFAISMIGAPLRTHQDAWMPIEGTWRQSDAIIKLMDKPGAGGFEFLAAVIDVDGRSLVAHEVGHAIAVNVNECECALLLASPAIAVTSTNASSLSFGASSLSPLRLATNSAGLPFFGHSMDASAQPPSTFPAMQSPVHFTPTVVGTVASG